MRLPRRNVIDYASPSMEPARRYSGSVLGAFILALLLPLFIFVLLSWRMSNWVIAIASAVVLLINMAAAVRLLESPRHILGDGLVVCGVMISGCITLIALLVICVAA